LQRDAIAFSLRLGVNAFMSGKLRRNDKSDSWQFVKFVSDFLFVAAPGAR
jgi:hypothetical protein